MTKRRNVLQHGKQFKTRNQGNLGEEKEKGSASDTPETDAKAHLEYCPNWDDWDSLANTSRDLERRLNEALGQRDLLQRGLDLAQLRNNH